MKILLIEDEDRGVRQAQESIDHVFGQAEVRVAGSLDEAKKAIAEEGFDLAICDIRIASDASSLDANEAHGLAAYSDLHANAPGTPAVFLSAFITPDNTNGQASGGGVADVLGLTDFPLTQVVSKGDPARIEGYLEQIREGVSLLNSCTVEGASELGDMFIRAVQMYALTIDSQGARVTPMGGKSGADVGLVRYSQTGHADVTVVIKLDNHDRARQERESYDRYVAPRLDNGDFAPQLKMYYAGLRGMTAVVSSLASPSAASLFTRLGPDGGQVDVGPIVATHSGWSAVSNRTVTTLGEYRETVIPNETFLYLPSYSTDLSTLDDLPLELSWKIGHGDFHGENLLIDDKGRAVLIDFADCGVFPAGLDAAALELSLYAHPKSPIDIVWPEADFASWSDVDSFVSGSPWAGVIRKIRAWALSEASERQMLSVYFTQACWLMKHGGVGATRMKAVALSIVSRLNELSDPRS